MISVRTEGRTIVVQYFLVILLYSVLDVFYALTYYVILLDWDLKWFILCRTSSFYFLALRNSQTHSFNVLFLDNMFHIVKETNKRWGDPNDWYQTWMEEGHKNHISWERQWDAQCCTIRSSVHNRRTGTSPSSREMGTTLFTHIRSLLWRHWRAAQSKWQLWMDEPWLFPWNLLSVLPMKKLCREKACQSQGNLQRRGTCGLSFRSSSPLI